MLTRADGISGYGAAAAVDSSRIAVSLAAHMIST
jgi:hypothetical protein